MTASVPTRVFHLKPPLTSWAGPYMSQFSFEAICGMISRHDQGCLMRESDDDDQL